VIEDKLVGIRDHQYNQLLSQLGTLAGICRGVGLQELHQDLAGKSEEGDQGNRTRST